MTELAHAVSGLCQGCDYPLRGLAEGRCPECGRAFDPADASTMNLARVPGPAARWLLAPMGWPVAAAALAPAAVLLWVATSPQLYYMLAEWGLSLLAFVAMVLGHGAWLVAKRVAARRYGRAATTVWNDHRRWAVVWAVTVVAAVLVVLKVPMRVSFLLHRPALERLVAEVRADAPTVQHFPGRHVGIYRLSDYPVDANGRALMFHFGATGEGGFAFSPDGEAELKYNSGDHGHLWGAWYWFSED